jgi:arylformamidase
MPEPVASTFFAAPRTRAELDADYAPSRFVGGAVGPIIQAWGARTADAKAARADCLSADIAYGPKPRQKLDLFRTASNEAPLFVFIHGGFWQAVSKDESGFVAPAWIDRGAHVAVLDYTLAPEATLPQIVAEVRQGLAFLAKQGPSLGISPRRTVVAGHSAGGHLAAMSQIAADDAPPVPVAGLVLVSGVFELEPIRQSYVNDAVRMTTADAAALSPVRHKPAAPVPLIVVVGENEPVAFQEQSRLMAWTWRAHGCAVEPMLIPTRTHFDILDDLGTPQSALGQATARLLEL